VNRPDESRVCGRLWPVCPDCPGVQLDHDTARTLTCHHCGRRWPRYERIACPDPATWQVILTGGHARAVCDSHAANLRHHGHHTTPLTNPSDSGPHGGPGDRPDR